DVEIRYFLELGQQTGEQLLLPRTRDPVQSQVEDFGLVRRDVEENDRNGGRAKAPGRQQPLVAADNRAVLTPGDDWVDQTEVLDASRESFQLAVGDPAWIEPVRLELANLHLRDGEIRRPLNCHRATCRSRSFPLAIGAATIVPGWPASFRSPWRIRGSSAGIAER